MKLFTTLRYCLLFLILGSGSSAVAHDLNDKPCPSATISYTASPYCSNSGTATVTLSGDGGGTYSAAAGLSIDVNTGDVDLAASTDGTYTVTYTIAAAGACGEFTTTTDITINAAPNASFNYPNSSYCTNEGTANINFSGTTGGTFSSDAGLAVDASSGNIDLGSSSAGTYTVTYTIAASGGCGEYTTTASITVNAGPFAEISYSSSAYCTNSGTVSVNLSGDGGGTYSSSGGLSIDSNTGAIDCSASSPGSYTVNYTVSNGCGSYTASTSVNIEATPDASISYDNSPYCSNGGTANVTFSGTSGGTYSSSAGLSIDPVTGQINLGASTPGMYNINYDVSSGNCSTTASASVTITAEANASISYPTSPYCSNEGVAYVDITGTTGGTFSAGAALVINSTTGEIDLAASTAGTYTVTYYIAAGSGCGDFQTTTDITITTAATADFYYYNSPACANDDTAMVSFTGTTGGTYSSTAGLSIDASSGTVNISASTPGSYTVTYVVAGSGGCSDLYAYANITIEAAASATISYSGSPYCTGGGTAGINFSGTSGGTYSADAGLAINTANGDVDLGASNPGSYTVTYTVTNICGTFQTTTNISITASPSGTISYDGSPYCSNGGTASVTVNAPGGGTYYSASGLSINSTTGDVNLSASTPGGYTVTYSFSENGCSGSADANIAINASANATISYDGSPYCLNSGTASVTFSGDAGGTYTSDAGLSINSTNGDVDLAASTAGTHTVTYTVNSSIFCGIFTTTADITINSQSWTGAVNTDWNNAGNWCGGVPTASSDVFFPAGLPNYPVIDASYAVHDINIATDAMVAVNSSGTLAITGAFNNSGAFSNDGKTVLNGSSAQYFPGSTAGSITMKDLEIDNAAGVTFDNKFTIYGTLTPTDGTITLTDIVTLKSDLNGTARVDIMGSGASFTYSGNGAFTVERYIWDPGHRAWHLLAAPLTGSQTIKEAWQEGGVTVTGIGTLITSNLYDGSNGFDAASNSSSILMYDQGGASGPSWTTRPVTNTNVALTNEPGYMLYVRGDRNATASNTQHDATVLRATGQLRTGTQSAVTVSATGTGRTLVGNPFASPIDFESIYTTTNLDQNFYIWDPALTGNYGVGGFRLVERNNDGTYQQTPVAIGGGATLDADSRYIHSGQAFFLKASGGDASVVFDENSKASQVSVINPIVQGTADQQLIANLLIVNTGNKISLADGIRVRFDAAYSPTTSDDVVKIGNFATNLAAYRDNKKLIVERRPLVNSADTIFLRISGTAIKDYRMQLATIDFIQTGLTAFLQDTYLGTNSNIDLNGATTNVDFSVNANPASAAADRFRIVFKPTAPLPLSFTGIKAVQQNLPAGQVGNAVAVEWKVANQVNIKMYDIERSADGSNFSKAGTQTATGNNGADMIYSWLDISPVNGNNFYRIRSIGIDGQSNYSALAKVNIGKDNPLISIYPNPVTARMINLQFTDMAKGTYSVKLINTNGQVVFGQQLVHNGGSASQSIDLGKTITRGYYQLEIVHPDGTRKMMPLVVAE